MSDSLGARWKLASLWYAKRPKREKLILAVAGLAVVWAVADAVWLTPALRMVKLYDGQLRQKETEVTQLETQRTALLEAVRLKEAELKRELTVARTDYANVTTQLAEFEKALVPARQMAEFLRSLLPPAGVEIVALKTLPPTPLIVRPGKPDEAKAKDVKAKDDTAAKSSPAANIYRHGMEITLAGNYDGLLAYLTRLEQSPQKVLWGTLELKVEKHPRNELTLVLYTLSLDPSWLVV